MVEQKLSELSTPKAIGIVYLAYLFIGYGGIYFTYSSGGSLALLWLGSGVSLSALIIFGTRIWPALWLGSFSAIAPLFVFAAPIEEWWLLAPAIVVPPTVNVLVQSLFAYYLYVRLLGAEGFKSTSSIVKFVFVVITIPTVFNSLILVAFYAVVGLSPVDGVWAFLLGWLTAGLGDIHGYFILVPVAITWITMRDKLVVQSFSGTNLLFSSIAFVALLTASLYFSGPLIYLLVPLAVIVSLNFGLQGTVVYIFLLSFVLTVATANNIGPFASEDATSSFVELLTFVFSMGIPLLILASERNQVLSYQQSLEQQVEERTRELSRAVAAKDEFLATISHELRTPLHAILGVVRIVDRSKLSDYMSSRMSLIESAGESLLTHINGILTFIRFSNEVEALSTSDFRLKELVHVSAALMESTASQVGSQITTRIEDSVPDLVNGSAEQLRQVLFNLLGNAVKYGLGTPIELIVTTTEIPYRIRVTVSDEGPGIPIEDQLNIFDQFTRLNPDQNRQQGTGLGLAVSKRLIEKMGGELSVESDGLAGTKMIFELPLASPVDSEPAPALDSSISSYRLLLLDDDPNALLISREFVEQLGHQVEVATTAEEAVLKLSDTPFDALLSDINLPDMSGLELIKHIKLAPARFSHCFTAALTASVLPAQEASFRSAGFDAVLSKPLDRTQLQLFFLALDRYKAIELQVPLINENFVSGEIKSLSTEAFGQLTDALETQGKVILEQIRQSDNVESLRSQLHLLASAASNFGLTRLQTTSASLEAALKHQEVGSVDFAELEQLYAQSIHALHTYLASLSDDSNEVAIT